MAMSFPLLPRSGIRSATWHTTNPPKERRDGQGRRRVGTRNLDWSKGGNGFRSLYKCGWWHSSLRHHAARSQYRSSIDSMARGDFPRWRCKVILHTETFSVATETRCRIEKP